MKSTLYIALFLTLFSNQIFAENSGSQLKSDLDAVLTNSYDTGSAQDSPFNSIITDLKLKINESLDWEFDELAPLIGNQVNNLKQLNSVSSKSESKSGTIFQSKLAGTSAFPNASYPDSVAWDFGIGANEDEPSEEAQDAMQGGTCSGSIRNTPRRAFDLQMGAIISEGIARVADSVCEQVVVVLGGGNASLACIVTEIADVVVQGVLNSNLLCDDIKDSADIEASYKRLGHIHSNLETVDTSLGTINTTVNAINSTVLNIDSDLSIHDTDIKTAVSTHDTGIKTVVSTHDTEIKTVVSTHDSDIKTTVNTHDTDIKALLDGITSKLEILQITANTNSAMLLEVVRLLHTPNGKRSTDITACDGNGCEWNNTTSNSQRK